MTEYICFFILLAFAIFGLCEVFHLLRLKFIFPKRKTDTKLIVYLNNETAEKQLLFVGEQYLWLGDKLADSIFADSARLDFDTYMRCREIAKRYNIIFN